MGWRQRLFDLGAAPYARMTANEPWRAHCRELARALDGETAPRRVLDLGVGPGVSAFAVLDVWPECTCVGVDLSEQMLARARKLAEREAGALELVWADATALPFEEAAFDGLVAHSFLYLVPDRAAVLAEAARVLAPGARVALLEPRAQGWLPDFLWAHRRADRLALSMVGWRVASRGFGRFDGPELAELFEGAGFVDVRLEPTLEGLGWLVRGERG